MRTHFYILRQTSFSHKKKKKDKLPSSLKNVVEKLSTSFFTNYSFPSQLLFHWELNKGSIASGYRMSKNISVPYKASVIILLTLKQAYKPQTIRTPFFEIMEIEYNFRNLKMTSYKPPSTLKPSKYRIKNQVVQTHLQALQAFKDPKVPLFPYTSNMSKQVQQSHLAHLHFALTKSCHAN